MEENDPFLFSDDNIRGQIQTAPFQFGYYTLRFYTQNGKPVNRKTPTIDEFYLYPSGGTLRDSSFNIVFYDSKYDTYRGFQHPHGRPPRR